MRFFEEIANRESRNENEIVLYPEGLFYKAYDRSAYACINRIPSFKPSKKRIKYCAREMASIGFPAAALSKYFPTAPRPLPDGRVVIALDDRIDADACQAWKMSLPLKERRPRGSSKAKAYAPVLGRNGRTGDLFVHPVDLLPDTPAAFAAAATGAKQGAKQPVPATGGKGGVHLPYLRNPQEPGLRAGIGSAAESAGRGVPGVAAEIPQRGGWSGAAAGTGMMLRTGPSGAESAGPVTTGTGEAGIARPTAAGAAREAGTGRPRETCSGEAAMRNPQGHGGLQRSRRPRWLVWIGCKILGINMLQLQGAPQAPETAKLRTVAGTVGKEALPERPRTFGTGAASETDARAAAAAARVPDAGAATREPGTWPGGSAANPATPGTAVEKPETTAAGECEARPKGCGARPTPEVSGAVPEQAGPTALRRDAAPACKGAGPRNETREQRAARLIREFRLEAATPVECLLFVADLKKEIDGYL